MDEFYQSNIWFNETDSEICMGFIKIMRQKFIIVHRTHILTQIFQIKKKKKKNSAQKIIELINVIILIIPW